MPAHAPPRLAVCAVTRDCAEDLADWWAALAAQELDFAIEISIVDSGSTDDTAKRLTELTTAPQHPPVSLQLLAENVGFADGMNRAIARTTAPWILSLNVDTRPRPDFLRRLLHRGEMRSSWRIGAVTGRLERFPEAGVPAVLDACGMRLALTWRHFDRGSGRVDGGEYVLCERVFGGTGAATLFRRAALDDVAIRLSEPSPAAGVAAVGAPLVFDPLFHSFREDAELAFRLRERGWETIYEPSAVALHRRSSLPERRRAMPALVNFHSLKNRYLLRAYHQTWATRVVSFLPTLVRDGLALVYVLLRERSSLAAYSWLWRNRAPVRARAAAIRARRTAGAWGIATWFLDESRPL